MSASTKVLDFLYESASEAALARHELDVAMQMLEKYGIDVSEIEDEVADRPLNIWCRREREAHQFGSPRDIRDITEELTLKGAFDSWDSDRKADLQMTLAIGWRKPDVEQAIQECVDAANEEARALIGKVQKAKQAEVRLKK